MSYSNRTKQLIDEYRSNGWTIHEGNNPRMRMADKWRGFDLVRICKTNSKVHKFSLYTVWASRRKNLA